MLLEGREGILLYGLLEHVAIEGAIVLRIALPSIVLFLPLFQVKHPRENKEHQKKIKGFILENVTQYTPTLIAGQLAPEDEGRFAILDVDQLAEVIQRYYLEKDPSFPVKE